MAILAAAVVPHPPIILPEIGHGEERKIAKTAEAYDEVMRRLAALKPETIVITSPHSVLYSDYFHISPGKSAVGDFSAYGVRSINLDVEYDTEFVSTLSAITQHEDLPAGKSGEQEKALDHGTMLPLVFLNRHCSDFRIVRIGLSGLPVLSHYHLGHCIAQAAEQLNRRVVLIASGDLSHKLKTDGPYGFAPEGPQFDRELTDALAAGDFLSILRIPSAFADAAAECGLRSFQIMAGALDAKAVTHELLSYEGPFGVGYGVAFFEVTGEDESRDFGNQFEKAERNRLSAQREGEDAYIRLARLSLETYVRTGRRAALPENLPEEMLQTRSGAFVSLKKHGQLRGCIGTTAATTTCVAEEIIRNAISAATEDPRFDSVTEDELPELEISVDVLAKTEPIDSPKELDVKRYGVIVQSGGRRGLLLPNLDGVDTVDEQIAISRRKAGIRPEEPIKLFRFEVVRHE